MKFVEFFRVLMFLFLFWLMVTVLPEKKIQFQQNRVVILFTSHVGSIQTKRKKNIYETISDHKNQKECKNYYKPKMWRFCRTITFSIYTNSVKHTMDLLFFIAVIINVTCPMIKLIIIIFLCVWVSSAIDTRKRCLHRHRFPSTMSSHPFRPHIQLYMLIFNRVIQF